MYVIGLRCMHNRPVNYIGLSIYVIRLRCVQKIKIMMFGNITIDLSTKLIIIT